MFIIGLVALFVSIMGMRLNVLMEPLGTDQGIFSYIGVQLDHGATVYKDVFDHKPPLIFYLYQCIYHFFPHTKATLFLFDTVYIFLFSLLIAWFISALLTRQLLKKKTAPPALFFLAAATFAFLICTKSLYEGGMLTEQYMIFFEFLCFAGLWRFALDRMFRPLELLGTGAALGIAVLWKPVALVVLPFIALIWVYDAWTTRDIGRSLGSALLLGIGVLTPHVLLFLAYTPAGMWQDYLNATFLFNIGISTGPSEFISNLLAFFKEQAPALSFVWLTAILLIISWLSSGPKKDRALTQIILFWGAALCCDLVGAMSSGRFFGHYFIQPLVPVTVLMTTAILVFYQKDQKKYLISIAALVVIAMLYQAAKIATGPFRHPEDLMQRTGAYLKTHTAPSDTIYVNGVKTGTYFYADRSAPWKYVHDFFLRVMTPEQRDTESRAMLAKRPKYIVITNPTDIFPPVQEALRYNYHIETTIGTYTIYKHN